MADDGPGFTDDMFNRASLPFARTTHESHGGAGLGCPSQRHTQATREPKTSSVGAHVAMTRRRVSSSGNLSGMLVVPINTGCR